MTLTKEERDAIRTALDNGATVPLGTHARLLADLDAKDAEIERLRTANENLASNCASYCEEASTAEAERDDAVNAYHEARRERDEARAEVERWREELRRSNSHALDAFRAKEDENAKLRAEIEGLTYDLRIAKGDLW
jgi:chromosome segregation ATPase